ncbi:hypothetical protein FDUTEX481_04936 [Tolypothrix sp. PCC 7601]|nr:hypothetical protein FDUTEX481_04936 [Tolypothrix sp. PCC 7601]
MPTLILYIFIWKHLTGGSPPVQNKIPSPQSPVPSPQSPIPNYNGR